MIDNTMHKNIRFTRVAPLFRNDYDLYPLSFYRNHYDL
jgi:hypothetical protein